MGRTTGDEMTTRTTDSRDATEDRASGSGEREVRGRHRLVAARARRGVRACGRLGVRVTQRAREVGTDAGMATAEYAIVTLAAVGFAGLLVVILKSGEVKGLLSGIVRQALSL